MYVASFRNCSGSLCSAATPEQMLVFAKGATNTSKSHRPRDCRRGSGPGLRRYVQPLPVPREAKRGTTTRHHQHHPASVPLRFRAVFGVGRLHADVIKRMTGEDTLTARKGHGNDFLDRRPDWTASIAHRSLAHHQRCRQGPLAASVRDPVQRPTRRRSRRGSPRAVSSATRPRVS